MTPEYTLNQAFDIFIGMLALCIFAQALGFALAAAITQFTAPRVSLALGAASGLSLSLATFVWRLKDWLIVVIGITEKE